MKTFSIIIPTFNRAHTIIRTLNSVKNQNLSKEIEVILVDDGSTDNTATVVNNWIENNKLEIKYLSQTHQGVSKARNFGVSQSNANWICFLDSDDEWLANKLKKQLQYILINPNIRIFQTEEIWFRNGIRVNAHKKHKKISGNIFQESLLQCMITTSSVAIRRDLWLENHGFDTKLASCEDYDLWLRITCKEEIGLLPENLLIRYGGAKDQLSIIYPVMDRFRIYAIIKNWNIFNQNQKYLAQEVLFKKLSILKTGLEKRNKSTEMIHYLLTWTKNILIQKQVNLLDKTYSEYLLDNQLWT
ncbi:MAG: glycosyltransferase family A protein [Leptospiraceae bacterium]|jgi:glycosyltransferase involved in cell wall biosynthesis|nr:glycosyltransferase family A protein [Leptospiraceae bacterium]MCZ8345299.1 glycosyltransferase family A protein [Leptospiraceae bacterium]